MGGSEGSEGGGLGGECGVGTIVWVRRRNGSWWPGRILGQEELSASHLMSPRSGTPVKLLGREDASVDWYNLEKSKRVKAFRCGEFDACIERAEASQGIPIKKREKYARREDAILHALELEKKMLEKQHKLGNSSGTRYSGVSTKEQKISFPSRNQTKNNESTDHGCSVLKSQSLSRKAISSSEASVGNPIHKQKGKSGKNTSREDNVSETAPRMRGLQDFGLRSAQSKRKVGSYVANESVQRPFLVETHVHAIPGSMHGMEEATTSSRSAPPFKWKKTQGGLNEEFLGKRRDRRRPLVQVLQSSAKLQTSEFLPMACDSIPVSIQEGNDQTAILSNVERKHEDDEPGDSNEFLDHAGYSSDQMQVSPVLFRHPVSLVDESDSSEGVKSEGDPDTEDDETIYPGITQSLVPVSNVSGRYVEDDGLITFAEQDKYGNVDPNDEPFLSSYTFPQYPHEQNVDATAMGVSKWNMKGKRNTRNLTKRPTDGLVGDIYSSNGRSYESKRHASKMKIMSPIKQGFYQNHDDFYETDLVEKDLDPQLPQYGYHRYTSTLKGTSIDHIDGDNNESDEDSPGLSSSGWDGKLPNATRTYSEPEGDHFDQFYGGHLSDIDPTWVDVDLKVQASYQGERVPLVSLMSRLNGKAIIGHPVQIETLDDGSTDALLARTDSGEDPAGTDGNVTPPPVWRTGRRTVMQRVPRPHPLLAALEGKEADSLQYSDPELKPKFKKPYPLHFDNQTRLTQKCSHSHRLVMPVKFQRKPLKKVSLSNQKTRTLSSLATQQKLGRFQRAYGKITSKGGSILDGLIKPGDSAPIVACVPVKVVFSRILEAVGRSPSTVVTHRGLLSCSLQKKPS